MKLLGLTITLLLCASSQAFTLPTVATVSLVLFTLNKPVSCVFGVFRRRSSPIEEAVVLEPESPFSFYNQPMTSGFNPFFGAGGYLLPAFGAPAFGMFGVNRFPPRIMPTRPIRTAHPKREVPSEMLPVTSFQSIPIPAQMSEVPSDAAFESSRGDYPEISAEDLESYFTLIAENDVNKCLARVICEIGAKPESEGFFARVTIDWLGSLNDFPDGSKVAEYHEALTLGMVEGLSACDSAFSMCDEESYEERRLGLGLGTQVYAVPREEFYTDSTL